MISTLVQCVKEFEKNLGQITEFKRIIRIFKSIAFLERNSLNRMHSAPELYPFYQKMDIFFADRIAKIKSIRNCGEVLIGFSKVLFFPENLFPVLKEQISSILLDQKRDQTGVEFFKKMDLLIQKITAIKTQLIAEKANIENDLNYEKRKNGLRNEIFKIEKQIQDDFSFYASNTNSIFEMNKLFASLSKFAKYLLEKDPEFIEALYLIASNSVFELYHHKSIINLLSKNITQGFFITIMRSVCVLFEPAKAIVLVKQLYEIMLESDNLIKGRIELHQLNDMYLLSNQHFFVLE